jgi:hypothetical protein
VLSRIFTLSSFANVLGGAVLFFTWASNAVSDPQHHVPIIVLAIGSSMIIQGLYSAGYTLGWWDGWGDVASGALLAGQLISGCVGLGMLVNGIAHNSASSDGEMAPVLAGVMIGVNAFLALLLLFTSGKLASKSPGSIDNGARA